MISLNSFLDQFKVPKGSVYNFTKFASPFGSFHIPDENIKDFYKIYCKHVCLNISNPTLTEKPGSCNPLCVDIDLKYDLDSFFDRHHYEFDTVKFIASTYFQILGQYIDISNVLCYVQERSLPYKTDKNVKDGFHLIFPNVRSSALLKEKARDFIVKQCKNELEKLASINNINDIVDKAVIKSNNWFIYGNGKLDAAPYLVTHVWDKHINEIENDLSFIDLTQLLSVRGETETVIWLEGAQDKLKKEVMPSLAPRRESRMISHLASSSTSSSFFSSTVDMDSHLAVKLVKLLKPERADNYRDWMNVGWALHNISESLLPNFVNFSRLSEKFKEGQPEKEWSKMKPGDLGMGSLIKWAKEDSFVAASALQAEHTMKDDKVMTAVDYAVMIPQSVPFAKVFKLLFPKQYVWPDCSGKRFYHFNGTYWKMHIAGGEIFQLMTDRIHPLFMAHASFFQSQLIDSESVEKTTSLNKKINAIHRAGNLLLSSGFRSQILKEIAVLYENPQFESHLDKNLDLLLFEDGVVDLRTKEFRPGRCDDLLTVSVGYNYPIVSSGHEADIDHYFRQCHTDDEQREYFLKEKAQRLSGHLHGQTLTLHTGSGSNSKSLNFEFLKLVFGGYFGTLPASVLTNKRSAPGAASPELASLKNARLVVAQEPERNLQLNASLIKELSGSDDIKCRDLYVGLSSYRPQYKVDLCCNKMPVIDGDDGGIIRRLRVIEWKSKFSADIVVDDFKAARFRARNLSVIQADFDRWKGDLMRMLIEKYQPEYQECPPISVTSFTNDYLKENNIFASFKDHFVEKASPDSAFGYFQLRQAQQAWSQFRIFMKSEFQISIPHVSKTELKSGLTEILQTPCLEKPFLEVPEGGKKQIRSVFVGYILREDAQDENV